LLRKIVTAVILIPLAIVIVAFAAANRQIVTVSFDPFSASEPAAAVSLPLFALLILSLIVGVIVGGVATWLRQGEWRQRARRLEREASELRRRLEALDGRADGPTMFPRETNSPPRLKLRPPIR